ncbi:MULTISPECIES: hypothetical protein [Bacillaceae]|uniref:hypothetical protein n=1 Tax=Bacillaceae TaxID=186817 RepID=UPI000E709364|nr:hypothetical protein [Bacillus sp. PK3_68]RJS59244.1 hypothetical protein CJ483_03490 [Bacillus sp. PK3_68]
MIRAIYTGDVRYNECNVFEYDNETKMFHMINDKEISYHFDVVMNDKDFIVFVTDGETAYQVEIKNRNSATE